MLDLLWDQRSSWRDLSWTMDSRLPYETAAELVQNHPAWTSAGTEFERLEHLCLRSYSDNSTFIRDRHLIFSQSPVLSSLTLSDWCTSSAVAMDDPILTPWTRLRIINLENVNIPSLPQFIRRFASHVLELSLLPEFTRGGGTRPLKLFLRQYSQRSESLSLRGTTMVDPYRQSRLLH